jgi:hypothetical protein
MKWSPLARKLWEKTTAREPLFVLDVPWLMTGMTLEGAMERLFHLGGAHPRGVSTAMDLMRILFNHANPRR